MRITEKEYYNELDKISLLDYKIDTNRNCNYFISGKNRYELHTITSDGIKDEHWKFQL